MTKSAQDYVTWFRNAAPYINQHRGKTMVLMFGGEALIHPNFTNIIHDIALLRSLGINLVIVHGARPQIEERMVRLGVNQQFAQDRDYHLRITDKQALSVVQDAVGSLRTQLEAHLTTGLANSPMHGSDLRVSSGNFVIAKPLGVKNGIDFQHTGLVRRVDDWGIRKQLELGSIVLLSPLGYSSTGEVFNLALEDVATHAAIALKADKLITFTDHQGLLDDDGELIKSCDTATVKTRLEQYGDNEPDHVHQLLLRAIIECGEKGIERCHCISFKHDTALLEELFTREGSGTLVSSDFEAQVTSATIDDIGGILELIQPLEDEGVLVRRSRKQLETEIDRFVLIKKENCIIACAALYPYLNPQNPAENKGELGCVVIHPNYRREKLGERLLKIVESLAKQHNLQQIFALTTVSEHWFKEQGFVEDSVEALPKPKQALYNYQRRSKVLVKAVAS